MASRAEWFAIATISGVGPARIRTLLRAYGTLEEALAQPDEGLMGKNMLSESQVAQLRKRLGRIEQIENMLDDLDMDGIRLIPMDAEAYPPLLLTIASPPPVLFARGDPECANQRGVAIVGARSASEEALEFAQALGASVAQAGLSVVSGLAAGVDAAAHVGCLEAGGVPVGVLGCGLSAVRQQVDLCEDVAREGLLLSELMPQTHATTANLMARNRIVASLARAVVALALGGSQGTISTVRDARRQGRPLFLGPIAAATESGREQVQAGVPVIEDPLDIAALIEAARVYDPQSPEDELESGGQLRLFP